MYYSFAFYLNFKPHEIYSYVWHEVKIWFYFLSTNNKLSLKYLSKSLNLPRWLLELPFPFINFPCMSGFFSDIPFLSW